MLLVMIKSIAGIKTVKIAFEEIIEILKSATYFTVIGRQVTAMENIADGITYSLAIGDIDTV